MYHSIMFIIIKFLCAVVRLDSDQQASSAGSPEVTRPERQLHPSDGCVLFYPGASQRSPGTRGTQEACLRLRQEGGGCPELR